MQTELDLGWSDFGVRCFDNWKAKWEGIDILSEYNANSSPYAYTLGNPIRYSDPTGMIEEDEFGMMSVSTDLWGGGRNQDFMNQSASDASTRAGNTQMQQAGFTGAGLGLWDGQLSKDIDTYTFDNSNATEEVSRELVGQDIRISYTWLLSGNPITGSGSGIGQRSRGFGIRKQQENIVHQFGVTGIASGGLGVMFSTGYTWDTRGNKGLYFTFGAAHGFDASFGLEYVQSRSINNNSEFSIQSLEGIGINYNAGIHIFDGAYGGDTNGYGNYGDKAGASYNSYSGGLSIGMPVGFTRSVEQTKMWRLNKKK